MLAKSRLPLTKARLAVPGSGKAVDSTSRPCSANSPCASATYTSMYDGVNTTAPCCTWVRPCAAGAASRRDTSPAAAAAPPPPATPTISSSATASTTARRGARGVSLLETLSLLILFPPEQAADGEARHGRRRRRGRRGRALRLSRIGIGRAARLLEPLEHVLELPGLVAIVRLDPRHDRPRLLVVDGLLLGGVVLSQVALMLDIGADDVGSVAGAVDVLVVQGHLAAQIGDPLGHPAPVLHVPLGEVDLQLRAQPIVLVNEGLEQVLQHRRVFLADVAVERRDQLVVARRELQVAGGVVGLDVDDLVVQVAAARPERPHLFRAGCRLLLRLGRRRALAAERPDARPRRRRVRVDAEGGGVAAELLAVGALVDQDAVDHAVDAAVVDVALVLDVLGDGAVLGVDVQQHQVVRRRAVDVDDVALDRRVGAQVDDHLAQPAEVAHLVAGDLLHLAGDVAARVAHPPDVLHVLHNGGVLAGDVVLEHAEDGILLLWVHASSIDAPPRPACPAALP